jgi:hypothetical protein
MIVSNHYCDRHVALPLSGRVIATLAPAGDESIRMLPPRPSILSRNERGPRFLLLSSSISKCPWKGKPEPLSAIDRKSPLESAVMGSVVRDPQRSHDSGGVRGVCQEDVRWNGCSGRRIQLDGQKAANGEQESAKTNQPLGTDSRQHVAIR